MSPPDAPNSAPLSGPELRRRLAFDDAQLLAECRIDTHRVKGPGGQHRNKTESAVRLVHAPSGITVTGTERRSQHENKAVALDRLREALALYSRVPLPTEIVWPPTVGVGGGRLRVSERNPARHHVVALALDALAGAGGQPKDAAAALGLTTSSYTKFLAAHPKAWQEANRLRAALGLGALHT